MIIYVFYWLFFYHIKFDIFPCHFVPSPLETLFFCILLIITSRIFPKTNLQFSPLFWTSVSMSKCQFDIWTVLCCLFKLSMLKTNLSYCPLSKSVDFIPSSNINVSFHFLSFFLFEDIFSFFDVSSLTIRIPLFIPVLCESSTYHYLSFSSFKQETLGIKYFLFIPYLPVFFSLYFFLNHFLSIFFPCNTAV